MKTNLFEWKKKKHSQSWQPWCKHIFPNAMCLRCHRMRFTIPTFIVLIEFTVNLYVITNIKCLLRFMNCKIHPQLESHCLHAQMYRFICLICPLVQKKYRYVDFFIVTKYNCEWTNKKIIALNFKPYKTKSYLWIYSKECKNAFQNAKIILGSDTQRSEEGIWHWTAGISL